MRLLAFVFGRGKSEGARDKLVVAYSSHSMCAGYAPPCPEHGASWSWPRRCAVLFMVKRRMISKINKPITTRDLICGWDSTCVRVGAQCRHALTERAVNFIVKAAAQRAGVTLPFPCTGCDAAVMAARSMVLVDLVIISHFHGDHINGLLTADNKPAFPRAEITVPAPEWKYFMDDAEMGKQTTERMKGVFAGARRVFDGLNRKVTQYETGKELATGIKAVATRLNETGDCSRLALPPARVASAAANCHAGSREDWVGRLNTDFGPLSSAPASLG